MRSKSKKTVNPFLKDLDRRQKRELMLILLKHKEQTLRDRGDVK